MSDLRRQGPISDEARKMLLDAMRHDLRQLEEQYERAPLGSAYRDDLRVRMSLLTDRWYEVFRSPIRDGRR